LSAFDRSERAKQRDRDDKRAKRKAEGAIPRHEYEANSASRNKPWLAEGMGRSAYYERERKAKLKE
jgi:hypothetical protein